VDVGLRPPGMAMPLAAPDGWHAKEHPPEGATLTRVTFRRFTSSAVRRYVFRSLHLRWVGADINGAAHVCDRGNTLARRRPLRYPPQLRVTASCPPQACNSRTRAHTAKAPAIATIWSRPGSARERRRASMHGYRRSEVAGKRVCAIPMTM